MGILQKAKLLANSGQYDRCGPKSCEVKINSGLGGIYNAKSESKNCRLFKTLMSNACSFDCKYCINSKCHERATYTPEELSKTFMHLNKTFNVYGLFLSSAIPHEPDKITEKMLEAVRILRFRYKFNGYVHFKILPGTSYELIKQASELADRLSINIEAPNKSILSELSTCKNYHSDILRRQAWISKLTGNQTTQLIVNNLATDKDILRMARWEYEKFNLKRFYFSAFKPVPGTELENEEATPDSRQNHLYNVDFLMRKYHFKLNEIEKILNQGMLPNEDPKLALAKEEFSGANDINDLEFNELLRVPGIGPVTARRIIDSRTKLKIKITKYEQLKKLGANINRVKPFVKVNGYRQKMLKEF